MRQCSEVKDSKLSRTNLQWELAPSPAYLSAIRKEHFS